MGTYTPRDTDAIKEDTNSILEKVKSNIYSVQRLEDSSNEKYDSCIKEIRNIQDQVVKICPQFRIELDELNSIITITVNSLIVAACTLILKKVDQDIPYLHIITHCKMGSSHAVQTYLIEEAERYALSQGIRYITISVPLAKMMNHGDIGFVPYPMEKMPYIEDDHVFQIIEMVNQANALYDTVYEARELNPVNIFEDSRIQPIVLTILRNVRNTTFMTKLRNNLPGQINSWMQRIEKEGSENLILRGNITLAKHLVNGSKLHDYPVVYPGGAIASTLGDGVNRFMELVKVNTYDLEDIGYRFKDQTELDNLCQGKIFNGFVSDLSNGNRGDNIVMTIEVSGVILAFCIITFKDVPINSNGKRVRTNSDFEPWVYLNLICAREYSGIGKRLLRSAELFAMRNGVNVFRLSALTDVIHWYHKQGFKIGHMGHGNNPEKVLSETPHMDRVLQIMYSAVEDTRKGEVFDHGQTADQIKQLKTNVNVETFEKLTNLMWTILSTQKVFAKRFIQENEQLLLSQADYLNRSGVMEGYGEWANVLDNGIHMSKIIK